VVGQIAFFLCQYQITRPLWPFPADVALIVAMGIQMGNTIIPTYIVDCYPLQSMSVITFYSVLLDLSAFINPVSEKKFVKYALKLDVRLTEL
jgi:cyanate permease